MGRGAPLSPHYSVPVAPIDHRSLTSAGLGLRRSRAPHWSRKVREKEKKSSKCPRWRPEGVTAPSAAPSSHPAAPHSSIPSSSLLQRRAAGRGCLRGRVRSSERRLGERAGVGGTAGGPEPQTHSLTHAKPQLQSHSADTHSRSSHQRSQCSQSAAPAHTRTKS